MQKLEVLDTRESKECGRFCYYNCKCCRMCQKRECWLIISPILLLVFGGVVVETTVKITFVRVLVWVSAILNLIIVFTTMIPGWEYIWLYLSKCLRHTFCFYCRYIRKYKNQERVGRYDPAPSIHLTKCPPGCPCAFWPTPYQYCGTECASCAVICLILVLWKKALKADYEECMKHTTDCNRDHIENYDREVSEWITFLIICIIVGFFNCCVGRNLIYYRISQAAHGDLSMSLDIDEDNRKRDEEERRERGERGITHPNTSVEVNNDVNNGIELTRIPNDNGSFHSQRNNNHSNRQSVNSTNAITIEVKEEETKEEVKEEVKEEPVVKEEEGKKEDVNEDKVKEGEKEEVKEEDKKEGESEKKDVKEDGIKKEEKQEKEKEKKESPKHHHHHHKKEKEKEETKPSTYPEPPV